MTIFSRLFLVCSMFLGLHTYSQDNYSLKWYSADSNHLPQNSVKSIAPDKYGYIWLATESGLVRYDGQRFKVYNSDNVHGLKADRFYIFGGSVSKDSLIIRNEINQLIYITKRDVRVVNKADMTLPLKLKPPFRMKFTEAVTSSYEIAANDYFRIHGDNDYYFIIGNDTIRKYDHKNRQLLAFRYKYPVKSEFFMQSGDLYLLGKDNDYIKFQGSYPKHYTFDHFFNDPYNVYTNMVAQQAFIFSENKLYYVKEVFGKLKIKCILEDFSLPHNNISSLYFDEKNDILYLGSASKGLLVVRKQAFKHNVATFQHDNGTNGVYYSLIKHKKGHVLSSTGEILNRDGNAERINIGHLSDKYMLARSDEGDLWTKNDDIIYRIKKESGYKEHISWPLDTTVKTLTKIDGKIWVSAANETKSKGTLHFIDIRTNKFSSFLHLDFAPTCLQGNADDDLLWVGSRFGLYRINKKTKAFEKIERTEDVNVRSIYIKSKNEIWITSYNKGILLYKDNILTIFPPDKNEYLLTSHCIVEDKKGFFWITTNRGLFQVKLSDLYNYVKGKNNKVYYYYYDKGEGFNNNEFNGGCQPCGVYIDQKTIFLPSIEGVVNFNPENTRPIEPHNGIYVDEIVVDSTAYKSTDGLLFKRNFDRITFFISSPYFGNQYNQNIEVKLEGEINQGWVNLKDGSISFSTLPPGDYILTARKLNGFNSEFITKQISFCVKPAFWQSKWFFIFTGVLILMFIVVIVKFRIKYIRYKNILLEKKIAIQTAQLRNTITALRKTQENLSRQNANHKKLIKTITHDIKSPLRFMAITGKYVYSNLDKDNVNLKDEIESIYTSSIQLYHFVDEFLEYTKENDNNSKSELYYLFLLVAEKIDFFKNIAASKKIELFNNIPMDITVTINKHLLSIIIHNLLDNAIKNTYTGTVYFTSSIQGKILKISIKDTGIGMSDEQVKYYNNLMKNKDTDGYTATAGMGLHAIIELLLILKGDMEIISSEHIGTQFILSFRI